MYVTYFYTWYLQAILKLWFIFQATNNSCEVETQWKHIWKTNNNTREIKLIFEVYWINFAWKHIHICFHWNVLIKFIIFSVSHIDTKKHKHWYDFYWKFISVIPNTSLFSYSKYSLNFAFSILQQNYKIKTF